MKIRIGYVSTRRFTGCKANKTIRLSSLDKKFYHITQENLNCLLETLKWNVLNEIFFFRISSHTIPFASHPMNKFNWKKDFRGILREIGAFIKNNKIRVSMHPGQFVVINSANKAVFENSVRELIYHSELLEEMELDIEHKIQIHVGGVYGDKIKSIKRFIKNYKFLPENLRDRLVIENDDRLFSLDECLVIHEATGIPIVFDTFHYNCNSGKLDFDSALDNAMLTWKDMPPMIDFSNGDVSKCVHGESIDEKDLREFIGKLYNKEADIMLEVRDKEISALSAVKILREKKVDMF
ncbi:UV DNA damage repair endonuclease UvsE [Thermodesulfovibrio hydrogeniphilus]